MEHLTLERLARLVDETPEAAEQDHLARCADCRRELAVLVEQTRDLSTLPVDRVPMDSGWTELEVVLLREGLLRPDSVSTRNAGSGSGAPSHRSAPFWLRIAASFLLFVLGGAAGWGVRGITLPESPRTVVAAATVDSATIRAVSADDSREAPGSSGVAAEPTEPSSGGGAELPAPESSSAPGPPIHFISLPASVNSLEEAAQVVRTTEALYTDALVLYRDFLGQSGLVPVEDPVGRYMALGNVLAITEEAVRSAPSDPFFNGLLINTVIERDAVERNLVAFTANR